MAAQSIERFVIRRFKYLFDFEEFGAVLVTEQKNFYSGK